MVLSVIRVIVLLMLPVLTWASNVDFDLYLSNNDQSKLIHVSNNEVIPLEGSLQIKVYSKQDGFFDIFYESQTTMKDSLLTNPIEIKAGQTITIPSDEDAFNLELSPGEVNFELAFTSEDEKTLLTTSVIAFDADQLIKSSLRDLIDYSNPVSTDDLSVYEIDRMKGNYNTLIEIKNKTTNIKGDLTLRGSNLYSQLAKGTVLIYNYLNKEYMGHGSGILLDDQHIITNLHVVNHADALYVVPYGGSDISLEDMSVHSAEILKVSSEKDLALIKTNPISDDIDFLDFVDESSIEVGMNTHAVGHPALQETWTYARGYVSNLRKNYITEYDGISLYANVIQNSTDVIPGFSGGPLTNEYGQVIGINSFIMPDGFQYAVSSQEVLNFLTLPNDFNGWENKSASTEEEGIRLLGDNSLEGYDCFDDNKDGKADYCARDGDNSGYYEEVYIDIDYDGTYDEFRLDANENEVDELVITIAGSSKYGNNYDKYYYDLQDDGSGFDQIGHDYDSDLEIDEYQTI